MAMKDKHSLVTDFAWYVSVLCTLARLSCSVSGKHARLIADQLTEISLRVQAVRPYAVETMLGLLLDDSIVSSQQRDTMAPV